MRNTTVGISLLLLAAGCSSMTHTEKGLLAGTGLGAGAGALVGSMTGNAGAGAAIGSVLGAMAGGLTGNAIDNAEQRGAARAAAALEAQRPRVSLQDVVRMTHQHLPDHLIINEIRTTNSVYDLSPNDVIYLKSQGVSDPVITEMQNRRVAVVQPVHVVEPRPLVVRETYVVHPAPPPPHMHVGFGWTSGGRCR